MFRGGGITSSVNKGSRLLHYSPGPNSFGHVAQISILKAGDILYLNCAHINDNSTFELSLQATRPRHTEMNHYIRGFD